MQTSSPLQGNRASLPASFGGVRPRNRMSVKRRILQRAESGAAPLRSHDPPGPLVMDTELRPARASRWLVAQAPGKTAILTLDLLFVRLALPWLTLCGVVYVTFVSGPLTAPTILIDGFWLCLCWVTLKALIAREIARTPSRTGSGWRFFIRFTNWSFALLSWEPRRRNSFVLE